jgi:hypothetical protein
MPLSKRKRPRITSCNRLNWLTIHILTMWTTPLNWEILIFKTSSKKSNSSLYGMVPTHQPMIYWCQTKINSFSNKTLVLTFSMLTTYPKVWLGNKMLNKITWARAFSSWIKSLIKSLLTTYHKLISNINRIRTLLKTPLRVIQLQISS